MCIGSLLTWPILHWHDVLFPVEGYTLAEIKHAEEEENKRAQSELTGKEEDSDETGAKQLDKNEEDQVRLLYAYTHVSQTTLIVYYKSP